MFIPSKVLPLHCCPPNLNPNPKLRFLNPKGSLNCHPKTLEIQCAKRTGKQRYPSEKKKLKLKRKALTHVNDKFQGIWRLSKLGVPVQLDPGKDFLGVSEGLLQEIAKVIKFPVMSYLDSKEIEAMKRDEGLPFSTCAFQFFFFFVWFVCWNTENNQKVWLCMFVVFLWGCS